jgi:hypothetical protein
MLQPRSGGMGEPGTAVPGDEPIASADAEVVGEVFEVVGVTFPFWEVTNLFFARDRDDSPESGISS